jgi:hypothetical protein
VPKRGGGVNLVPIDSAVRFGEIIPPGSSVRVIGTTHPLNAVSGARIERHLDVGLTLDEMLQEALDDHPDIRTRRDFIVCIDSDPIEECNWHRVRAKAGTVVTFRPRLQGGNALRTVLGVVVAVAAIILSVPTGGMSLAVAGALNVSAATASALIAGGILPAGPMALDALFQPGPDAISKRLAPEASLDGMVGA